MAEINLNKDILPVPGVKWSATYAGIKKNSITKDANSLDLALMEVSPGSNVASVFTKNIFSAAPVKVAQEKIDKFNYPCDCPIYLLINSGNANAGTGDEGIRDTHKCCQSLSDATNSNIDYVVPFSTGVIGEKLPVENIITSMPSLVDGLSSKNWEKASRAIMTTDTVSKAFSRSINIDDKKITITGICKGAGMIRPNMATMLSYVATDAEIDQSLLQELLNQAVNQSFNRITVDGDTSTNDACILVATGESKIKLSKSHPSFSFFYENLFELFSCLATSIIKDAEGATKFITISVEGGLDSEECLLVAYAVAESPLVKTAFFASDPNWGRILAAIGRSGVQGIDINSIEIILGGVPVFQNGKVSSLYNEEQVKNSMNSDDILLTINLKRGSTKEKIWTSDLSIDYIKINSDYRS
jgi:glutamate N-acetyltransferase/amino-acid N-acetyltransferase